MVQVLNGWDARTNILIQKHTQCWAPTFSDFWNGKTKKERIGAGCLVIRAKKPQADMIELNVNPSTLPPSPISYTASVQLSRVRHLISRVPCTTGQM